MSIDLIILIVRLCVTLTFLILAVGGPWANHKLNKFMKVYFKNHRDLQLGMQTQIDDLKRENGILLARLDSLEERLNVH